MGLDTEQKIQRRDSLEKLTITNYESKKDYVFISYKSDDWEKVFKKIVLPLQQNYGLNVYCDKAFDESNDIWLDQMKNNIDNEYCKAVLVFLSVNYLSSYATMLELMYNRFNTQLLRYNKMEDSGYPPVIPIVIDDESQWKSYFRYKDKGDVGLASDGKERSLFVELSQNITKYFKYLEQTGEQSISASQNDLIKILQLEEGKARTLTPFDTYECILQMKTLSNADQHNEWIDERSLESIQKTIKQAVGNGKVFEEVPKDANGMAPNPEMPFSPEMQQGMYGQMPQGMYGQMPQGMYPQAPQGMYQQMPQGMYPQMPQGMYQQMPQGMYPQMPQGMYPQMPQGMYPQTPQGMPVAQDMNMPMENGGGMPPQEEVVSAETEKNEGVAETSPQEVEKVAIVEEVKAEKPESSPEKSENGKVTKVANDENTTIRKKPSEIICLGKHYPVNSWNEVLMKVTEILCDGDSGFAKKLVESDQFNTEVRTHFSFDKEAIKFNPKGLPNGLWLETNKNATTIEKNVQKMMQFAGYSENDLKIVQSEVGDLKVEVKEEVKEDSSKAGNKPVSLVCFGTSYPISSWKEVLMKVCEVLCEKDSTFANKLVESNRFNTENVTHFSFDKEAIKYNPKGLPNGLWLEANKSADHIRSFAYRMMEFAGYSDSDLTIVLPNTAESEEEAKGGQKPVSIVCLGKSYPTKSWKDILMKVCEILCDEDSNFATKLVESDKFNTATRTHFSFDKEAIKFNPKGLPNGLWLEANKSSGDIRRYSYRMMEFAGHSKDDLKIVSEN